MATPFDFNFNLIQHKDAEGSAAHTIVEASEPLALTQVSGAGLPHTVSVPETGDLTVYADEVMIHGAIAAPGKRITIVARRIMAKADPSGKGPCLDVSGRPGEAPDPKLPQATEGHTGARGTSGKQPFPAVKDTPGGRGWSAEDHPEMHGQHGHDGHPGHAGGRIELFCWELETSKPLALLANGGIGGKGQAGQDGGKGGDGGPGADGAAGFFGIGARHATAGGDGGNGGNGGYGGAPGTGGNGGHIHVMAGNQPVKAPTCNAGGGGNGQPGPAGAPGDFGRGGKGGRDPAQHAGGQGGPAANPGRGIPERYQPDGDDGVPGNPLGSKGTTSEALDGAIDARFALDDSAFLPRLASAFDAHAPLEQLRMLYRSARLAYLSGDPARNPKALSRAWTQLGWLRRVLTALHDTQGHHADEAQDLLLAVEEAWTHLRLRRNLFGHGDDWVPLGSVSFYDDALAETLATLQVVEQTATGYANAAITQEEQRAQAQALLDHARALDQAITQKRLQVSADIDSLVNDIDTLQRSIAQLHTRFNDKVVEFDRDIDHAIGMTGSDLWESLGTLAFMPHGSLTAASMVTSQTGKMSQAAMDTVTTDAGGKMRKELVIHQMDTLSDEFATLAEGFKAKKGRITVDDPNAYKLQVTRQKVDQLLNNFKRETPVAQELHDILSDYVEAVTHRNAKIAAYNAAFATLSGLIGQQAEARQKIGTHGAELEKNACPNLPAMRNYMLSLYERAKEDSLRTLYYTNLAHNFWCLEHGNALYDTLNLGSPTQIDHTTLEAARGELKEKNVEKRSSEAIGKLSSFPEGGTGNETHGVRLTFYKDQHPELFETFREPMPEGKSQDDGQHFKHVMEFSLPAVTGEATLDENHPAHYSPFAGKSNVRLTVVRAWLHGMQSDFTRAEEQPQVIHITQLGKEDIADRNSQLFQFEHANLSTVFRYDATRNPLEDERGIIEDGHMTDEISEDIAYVGPFSRWRISVHSRLNPGLDVSEVKKLVIEFRGCCDTFKVDE